MPRSVKASIRPGYTVSPVPSITTASGGTSTFDPTDLMSPLTRTMVPPSIGAPETGTIRALRMAMGATGWACPMAPIPSAHTTPNAAVRKRAAITNTASSTKCMSHHARRVGKRGCYLGRRSPTSAVRVSSDRPVTHASSPWRRGGRRCRDHDERRHRVHAPHERRVARGRDWMAGARWPARGRACQDPRQPR